MATTTCNTATSWLVGKSPLRNVTPRNISILPNVKYSSPMDKTLELGT